jgi:hypothetical protein
MVPFNFWLSLMSASHSNLMLLDQSSPLSIPLINNHPLIAPSSALHDAAVARKQKAFRMVTKETVTMATSEGIRVPEAPNVLFIYNEDTQGDIPLNVTHVKVDFLVEEIHDEAFIARHSLVKTACRWSK